MKKYLLLFLLILIVTSLNSASFAITLTDYKVPVSTTQDLEVTTTYNYHGIGDSTKTNLGSGTLNYKRYYESLPFGYSIQLFNSATYDGEAGKNLNNFHGEIQAIGSAKKYIAINSLFGFGGLIINYKREQTKIDSLKKYKRPDIELEAGLGYGKYINATPLAKALRVEEELKKMDSLTGNLPDETRLELAKLLTEEKKQEYEDKFEADIWERYYFDAIEEVLLASGMLKGERMEALAVIRIQQVIYEEHFNDRFYGWEARVGVTQDVLTPRKEEDPKASLKISFGYAMPLTLSSQFEISAETKTELDAFFDAYEAQIRPEFSYELSNKIDFAAYYQLDLEQEEQITVTVQPENPEDPPITKLVQPDLRKSHEIKTSLEFYIEGKMSLVQQLSFKKNYNEDYWNKIFTLTLRYDIL